jgi:2-amino-4-hydroxy-6-hydroxymethyldihydropteridine diphosphokinase
MTRTYLSLGSNVGDREANLRAAIERLPALRISRVYETEPVDFTDQPWFLNLVVEMETDLSPLDVLATTSRIEEELGRVRTVPKGPRMIDIDILLYGDEVVNEPTLQIPHPRMAQRRFVLAPLADLAPDLRHPATGKTVRQMLADAPPEIVRLLGS